MKYSVRGANSLSEMERPSPAEGRGVLGEVELELEHCGLCPPRRLAGRPVPLRTQSLCGAGAAVGLVSYAVEGFLDNIYVGLVVKLADSESF